MKNKFLVFVVAFCIFTCNYLFAQYNNLWIPDTLSGTNFNLAIKDTFKQIRTGQQTITGGINNSSFWGPTLIFNKGETVHMNVTNQLNDTTTLHWHGMHLPAVMDGGPHQVIPPGTLWQPFWTVTNQAGTYWYHPHLHEMTLEQMTKGIGGFIIVRDGVESNLALPRKYGVDDIPIVLTSRSYTANNQFAVTNITYGDYMLTNGVPNAQVSLPKQFVRLRILNAEIERGYDLGFSDNRTFYVIANDGGLLNAPVARTRVKLLVGERIEIMVNLGNDAVGSSLDLKAYNSNQAFGFPGGEPNSSGPFGSLLNNIDFTVLHMNIIATTSNPITAVPSVLANNVYWTATDATVSRNLAIAGGNAGSNIPFNFDNAPFVLNTINKTVNLNDIEKWTITNSNVFGHTFHIHDVQFKIVARNGSAAGVGDYESGWKDVIYVPKSESVSFVAKFDDYSDAIHPYMYHCHFSNHEDDGMMGQFVVNGPVVSPTVTSLNCAGASFSASATVNAAYTGSANVPYAGGNGVACSAGLAISSTGVTGLTATLVAGTLANGAGTAIYTITGTPVNSGTANFAITLGGQSCTLSMTVNNTVPTVPTVTNLSCNTATFSNSATVNTSYSGTAIVPYTGANGLAYTTGSAIASTGVIGLTATLQPGTLANGSGTLTYAVVGTPTSTGIANFAISAGGQSCTLSLTINDIGPVLPAVVSLLCNQATFSGTAYANTIFSSTVNVPYTGGNGATYPLPGPAVSSTGVTGLTAVLHPGTLFNGSGNLTFTITGTPASSGVASFLLDFGGQTCSLDMNVLLVNSVFDFVIAPNPVKDILQVLFIQPDAVAYYVWIYDELGRTVRMLPQPDLSNGINVSQLSKGYYYLKIMDKENKSEVTKKFLKK